MTALKIPDLASKVFLVTGASTGIGAAVARALAQQGAAVAVHYHSSEAQARELAEAIRTDGGQAFVIGGNMAVAQEVEAVIKSVAQHFGRIDGLINNAGSLLGRRLVAEFDEAYDRAVLDLNAHSVVWASRAALPWLRKQGGVIINTTSVAARNGGAGGSVLYAAAKGFVSTFTRGFAKEVVNQRIRVNAVLTRYHSDSISRAVQQRGANGRNG